MILCLVILDNSVIILDTKKVVSPDAGHLLVTSVPEKFQLSSDYMDRPNENEHDTTAIIIEKKIGCQARCFDLEGDDSP